MTIKKDIEIDNRKRIAFDLDGTITIVASFPNIWDMTPRQLIKTYNKVKPDLEMIKIEIGRAHV